MTGVSIPHAQPCRPASERGRRPWPVYVSACAALLLSTVGPACAQDAESAALLLADSVPEAVQKPSDWRAMVEGAYGAVTQRNGSRVDNMRRLSFDFQYDKTVAAGWRVILANRLDMSWPPQAGGSETRINTVKDAYLSWQPGPAVILDLGRVDAHEGVANGYNPTDYFRAGAVRSVVSADPFVVKQNREGSVMGRAQFLWNGGALNVIVAPESGKRASASGPGNGNAVDFREQRALISIGQKLNEGSNGKLLVYKQGEQPAQVGINLSSLVGDATVVYAEWSGGRSKDLLAQALDQFRPPSGDGYAFRNRLATGLTYTTTNKMSLTAEFQYNGAGLDKGSWQALGAGPLPIYAAFLNFANSMQEAPTKNQAFFYANWQDALIARLDIRAMHIIDVADRSRLSWLEARYRFDRIEYAFQWQRNTGHPTSHYGVLPQENSVQASARFYF